MTAKNKSHPVSAIDCAAPFPWLTVNVTLWGLLLIVALGLRLFRLDAVPLNAAEARGALAAWRQSTSTAVTASGVQAIDYSPVLFSAQWFTFLIFSANELTARLWPAVAGAILALSPALLRRQLGRVGILATGILLALSPTALTLSRTASGDVLVALGALLCVGGVGRYLSRVPPPASPSANPGAPPPATHYRPLLVAALGAALVLASSPLSYSVVLSLAPALLALILMDPDSRDRIRGAWTAFRETPNAIPYTLGVLIGAFVLFSTAFAWNLKGLGAATDLLSQWLDGFVRRRDSLSLGYPLLLLFIYEPLVLLSGVSGAALAFNRGVSRDSNHPRGRDARGMLLRFLTLWSIAALVLALIRPGRGPGDVLLALVPLACLGGSAIEALIRDLKRWGSWLNEGLYLVISAPLWVYLALNLANYSSRPGQYTQLSLPLIDLSLPTYLGLTLAAIFMLLVLPAIIGFLQGLGPMLRGLGTSTMLALLVFTIATAWGVSQNRPGDPREPLVLEPTATEVHLLSESLARLSSEHHGGARAIDLTVLSDDPALAWALRDFPGARFGGPGESFTDASGAPLSPSAVVAPQTLGTPDLGGAHIGQSFPLRRRWRTDDLACRWNLIQLESEQIPQLDCSALVQWFVFRRSPQPPVEERVVLWLRQDSESQETGN